MWSGPWPSEPGICEESSISLRKVLECLAKHLTLADGLAEVCVDCVDVLDAVVCLLSGADFLAGRATPPAGGQEELARKEGWIWCRAALREK